MNEIKELLSNECNRRFSMDEPVMEKFIGLLTEVELPRGGCSHVTDSTTVTYI